MAADMGSPGQVPPSNSDTDDDDIPAAIRLVYSDCVQRLDQGLDEQLTTDIRNLILACQKQGVWERLRVTIPFPGRAVFEVLAQAKPIPKRVERYMENICLQWGVQKTDFQTKFFGASSQGFFEELNRLAFAEDCPVWTQCWSALLAAREERLRGATGPKLVLWLPSDIHRAARSMGVSVAFKRIHDPSLPGSGRGKGGRRYDLGPRPLSPPLSAPATEGSHGEESDYESDDVSPANGSSTRQEPSQEYDEEEPPGRESRRRRDPTPARSSFLEDFENDDIPEGGPARKRQRRNSHTFAGGTILERILEHPPHDPPHDYPDFDPPDDYADADFSPQRSELGHGAAMDSKASTAYPNPPRPLGSPFQLETAGIKVSKGSPKNTGCQFVEPAPIRASAPLGFRQLLNAGSRDANRPGTPFPLQTSLFPAHIEKSSHDMGTQVGFGPYSAPAREAGSRGVKRPASPLPPQTSNRDVGTQTSLSPPHHPAHINKTSNDMGTQTSEPKEMEEGSPRDMQTKAGLGSDPSGTLTLQPGSRGAKRLMDPQAWLDDTVIDMALSACAALGGQHDELITIPSSMSSLESNPENCPVYIQHLKSLPRDRLEALVPLNPGRHWVLAQANFGDRTVYLYDSMSSARQGTVPASTQALIHSFLDRLFGENPAHWRVTLCSCPQQVDDSSCGIFSIATAFHVAARKPLPANYSPFFWRSVILCLLCPSRKNTALWPFTAQDDDAAIKAWSTEQASPDTERDVHDELSSGCSVTRRMAILQQMMDSAKARLGKCQQRIEQDIAARESVLAELVVLDSISQGPGTAEEGAVPQGGLGLSAEDVDKQWRAIETTMSQFALCPELAHPEQISLLSNRRAELRPVKLRMKLAADAKRAREVLLQRLDGPLKEAADIGLASVDKLGQARREMEL